MKLGVMMKLTLLACVTGLVACASYRAEGQWAGPMADVVFPDATRVRVEVADTEPKRDRGLMFRKSMAANEGMIFLFDEPGFYPFWMKNTLIPLDMLWLDGDGKIVSIAEAVPCKADPCPSIPPAEGTQALYVVELVSGFAKEHKLKVGDLLVLKGLPEKSGQK